MNLYNSKKLKTLKSKKLTVKCNTGGGQRRKSKQKTPNKKKPKQHKPSKPPTPSSKPPTISALSSVSKQQVPGATSQGPASASKVSGTTSTIATSALKRVESARKARAASAASAAAAASASVAAASGVSSLKPMQLPPSILPSAALVYKNRFCTISSKKKNKRILLSDNKPIFQEIVHDSKHILSSDPVIFKNLILFADKKYNEISIDKSTIGMLNKINFYLYAEREEYVRNVLRNYRVNSIDRTNSTLPNNSNNIVSTKESTLEKIKALSDKIAKPNQYRSYRKIPQTLIDNSKNLIKYTADIELITSADIMNMLASMFFIYFNSSLDNTDCNKNDIAGIRIYDRINTSNNTVNYYEKKISNLNLGNKQEIVLVDYENYNIGMENVTKLFKYGSIQLNNKPFDICDICKVHPNKLFIFIRTLKDRFRLYELVEKDNRYNNLLYINVFGRTYVGTHKNTVVDKDMETGTYASIMTDDFLLIELYNFLKKKNFDVSVISRDKYDIISNKNYYHTMPKFNIYKYYVDSTGYNVEEIKVRNFQFYENSIYEAIVRRLITNPITNKNGVPIRINNLKYAVNDIAATRYNSNNYHYFLLLIYILQNYAP